MKKTLLLLSLCLALQLNAQQVPEGYRHIGTISNTFLSFPGEVVLSPDSKYFVIEYGFKPTKIEVYKTKGFEKIQTFIVKGYAYFFNSAFDPQNTAMLYVGSRGNRFHKLDLTNGTYKHIKQKFLPDGIDPYGNWVYGEHATTKSNEVETYTLPEKYVVKFFKNEIKVYVWEKLLD